jgi:hypothetical protein
MGKGLEQAQLAFRRALIRRDALLVGDFGGRTSRDTGMERRGLEQCGLCVEGRRGGSGTG